VEGRPLLNGGATTIKLKYKSTVEVKSNMVVQWEINSGKNKVNIKSANGTSCVVASTRNFYPKRGTVQLTAKPFGGTAANATTVNVKVTLSFVQWLIIIFLFGWIWY